MKNPNAKSKKAVKEQRPVSEKFYDDICKRVYEALKYSHDISELMARCMRMLDLYMTRGECPKKWDGVDLNMVFSLLRPEIDRAMARSKRARENAARRREAKAAARRQPQMDDVVSEKPESVAGGLHGETGGLLKSEKEVHGVDSVSGTSLEQVVDHGRDKQLAVDLVEVDDALVGVDHVLQVMKVKLWSAK